MEQSAVNTYDGYVDASPSMQPDSRRVWVKRKFHRISLVVKYWLTTQCAENIHQSQLSLTQWQTTKLYTTN